jgi:hypothetical protein
MRKTLIALAGLALAAAPLSAANASPGHDASIGATKTNWELGDTVTITGHVDGITVKGYSVDIHAGYSAGQSGGLVHIGHADVHSSGNFTKSYKAPEGGTYAPIVEVDDKNGDPVGGGEGAAFRVFRWTALQNVNMVPGQETPVEKAGKTTGKSVAGVKWAHELFLRSGAELGFSWEFYNPCSKIQSYVGISDSAPEGATANVQIRQGEGDPFINFDLTKGTKARHFTRDLDPEFPNLTASATFGEGTDDTVGSKVIFGEPKAFCAVG